MEPPTGERGSDPEDLGVARNRLDNLSIYLRDLPSSVWLGLMTGGEAESQSDRFIDQCPPELRRLYDRIQKEHPTGLLPTPPPR